MLDTQSDNTDPRTTLDLLGHRDAEQRLLGSVCSGRLAHAWLVTGPQGIGKATLCYRFAKFLLANPRLGSDQSDSQSALFETAPIVEQPTTLAVDPKSSAVERVHHGSHGDLKVIERRVNEKTGKLRAEIIIDDIRTIQHLMTMTSMEGGWRVVIIDAAEDMNRNAANALLKVLEEPPRKTVLLLISHAPGQLLPTIRSRCQVLPLKVLSDEVLSALLKQKLPDLEADERDQLIGLSEGSIGRALSLYDEGGVDYFNELMSILAQWPNFETPTIHALGERLSKRGEEATFKTFTDLFHWWLARFIISMGTGKIPKKSYLPGEDQLMERFAKAQPLGHWLRVWDEVNAVLAKTETANLDKKQVILGLIGGLVPNR